LPIQGLLIFRGRPARSAVTGPISLGTALAVTRTFALRARLAIAGTLTFRAAFAITGTLTFRAAFAIAGTLPFSSAFAITGTLTFGAAFAIAGTLTFRAALAITGTLTFRAALAITGTLTLRAAFAVTRAIAFRAALAIARSARGWERRSIAQRAPVAHWRRHHFVKGQFAIVVPIELSERLGRVIEFLLGDLSVAVLVQHGDHRRHHWSAVAHRATGWAVSGIGRGAFAAIAGRAVGLTPAFAGWSGRWTIGCLRDRKSRRQGECECDEDCLGFHGFVFWSVGLVFVWRTATPAAAGSMRRERRKWEAGVFLRVKGFVSSQTYKTTSLLRIYVQDWGKL
jgi:hypothetical protein